MEGIQPSALTYEDENDDPFHGLDLGIGDFGQVKALRSVSSGVKVEEAVGARGNLRAARVPPFRPPTSQPFPWCVVSHGRSKSRRKTSFYSMFDAGCYLTSAPQLNVLGKNAICCSKEWVVIHDAREPTGTLLITLLLNLKSSQTIDLPTYQLLPDDGYDSLTCVVTAPPTDPDCIVGLFSKTNPTALIWRPGQDRWVQHVYGSRLLHRVSVCNRKIYGLLSPRRDGTIENLRPEVGECEMLSGRLEVKSLGFEPPVLAGFGGRRRIYFVGSQDVLFILRVYTYFRYDEIAYTSLLTGEEQLRYMQVFKFDEKIPEWVQVMDLGSDSFFINSESQSFCCSSQGNSNITGNRICFANLYGRRDKKFYVYDLRKKYNTQSHSFPNAVKLRSPAFFIMV